MSTQTKLPLLLELITNLVTTEKTAWTLEQIAQQTGVKPENFIVLGLETAPKIDELRELLSQSQIKAGPKQSTQVFAILDLDQARVEVQHALLKSLEEPASGATFVLTCSNLGQILATVQSRCQLQTIYHYQLDEEKLKRVGQWWQLETIPGKKYYELISLTTTLLKNQTELMEKEYKNSSITLNMSELTAARALLLDLLHFTHYRTLTPITRQVLSHYRLLTQNVNAKLVIEDLLFTLKNPSGQK